MTEQELKKELYRIMRGTFDIEMVWDFFLPHLTTSQHDREIKREETHKWYVKLDSIVNAHLWGDYGKSLNEIDEGCKKLLVEMKTYLTQQSLDGGEKE